MFKQLEEVMNHPERVTWLDAAMAVLLLILAIIAAVPFFIKDPLYTNVLHLAIAVHFMVSITLFNHKKIKWALLLQLLPMQYVAIMFYIDVMK